MTKTNTPVVAASQPPETKRKATHERQTRNAAQLDGKAAGHMGACERRKSKQRHPAEVYLDLRVGKRKGGAQRPSSTLQALAASLDAAHNTRGVRWSTPWQAAGTSDQEQHRRCFKDKRKTQTPNAGERCACAHACVTRECVLMALLPSSDEVGMTPSTVLLPTQQNLSSLVRSSVWWCSTRRPTPWHH